MSLRLMLDHLIFLIRGCQHPKLEPEGSQVIDVNGEAITFFLETCVVCGITLIHEV